MGKSNEALRVEGCSGLPEMLLLRDGVIIMYLSGSSTLEWRMTGVSTLECRMTGVSTLEWRITGESLLEWRITGVSVLPEPRLDPINTKKPEH